ncbi:cold-shock protein [Nocardia suismassiliense]|uniref:cold-shock protein n=1 Tax=Nocardia suismassiliense TaxID=2077092 RepID=UPI000D1F003C|nr:cold shock domain-containing protein [Nocardia suismassiliense]
MEYGTVKNFHKQGWGRIVKDSGGDIYVHHSDIVADGYRMLEAGQRVSFVAGNNAKGPIARHVRVQ